MSIYKLKLGFSRLFRCLWMFPKVQGLVHIKEWCFGPLKMKFHYPRKRVCVCTLDSCVRITYFPTALMARLQTVITNSSKLGKICIQIEAQDVYFPMKQTLLKKYLWSQSYGQNSKKMSFSSIVFKVIWALLSQVYFQTIVNSLITLGWRISSLSLEPGTKTY